MSDPRIEKLMNMVEQQRKQLSELRMYRRMYQRGVKNQHGSVIVMGTQNERADHKEPFVKLEHWILKTDAYRALSPNARVLLIELMVRFNGNNNGDIHFSIREMAVAMGIKSTDAVTKAHRELQAKGFVRITHLATFDTSKTRRASEWELTMFHTGKNTSASKEFARWRTSADDLMPRSAPAAKHSTPKRDVQYTKP